MDFDSKRDMGLTPKQQEARWNQLFNPEYVKQSKVKRSVAKHAPTVRQSKKNNTVRPRALEMYASGMSVKEVAAALNISQANAYYYQPREK